jgi:hypothetical protein
MAYVDPNTGISRDKSGNELPRDAAGTDPHSHTSYWTWILGALFVVALLFAVFGMNNDASAPSTSNSTVTEPATPKSPPPAQ